MRAFVILCLVAAVSAQYDYSQQNGPSFSGYATGPSANYGSSGPSGVGTAPASAPEYSQPKQAAEYNKEFYSFAVNDNEFQDGNNVGDLAESLKKNLRVIFIKGPEHSGLEDAAVALAKSAGEQRTAIYVLNKQADLSNLASKLNSLQNNANQKPEVHFVKYRTQADAENAQRAIQSQYDSLPGPSSTRSGGHAPVHDFASKPAVAQQAPAQAYIPPAAAPTASYLPPSFRF